MSDKGPSATEADRLAKALLAAYVAGTLSEPFAVLVASYLQMKEPSRQEAFRQESWRHVPVPGMEEIGAIMPLALRSYVARHQDALEWRRVLPGIERCRISRDAQADASLLRCRPGSTVPAHTHRGLEAVLVLQGGFHDAYGHYGAGDIAVADGTIKHRPVNDRALTCIIFVVLEASVRLTGPFGSLIQRIFGG